RTVLSTATGGTAATANLGRSRGRQPGRERDGRRTRPAPHSRGRVVGQIDPLPHPGRSPPDIPAAPIEGLRRPRFGAPVVADGSREDRSDPDRTARTIRTLTAEEGHLPRL